MYKAKNNLSPQIAQDIFQIRNTLPNIRTQHDFALPKSKPQKSLYQHYINFTSGRPKPT